MKLSIEIFGDDVKFDYEVGSTKAHSTTKFSADWLEAFTAILQMAHRAWSRTIDERKEQIWHAANLEGK